MKNILITFLVFCCMYSVAASAQIRYVPTASKSFSISLGGGGAMLFGDLQKQQLTPAARANLDYNITSYFSIGLEAVTGKLKANTVNVTGGPFDVEITNTFYAGNINTKVSWGKIFGAHPASIVNGFYFGVGVGLISHSIEHNKTDSLLEVRLKGARPNFDFQRTGVYIPVNVGIDLDLSSVADVHNLGANINYQHNVISDDYLDGIKPGVSSNGFPDSFGFLSVAVKYYFGRLR